MSATTQLLGRPLLTVTLCVVIGCSGAQRQSSSQLESLRSRIGLPDNATIGEVDVIDGTPWLVIPIEGTLVPVVKSSERPPGAEASGEPGVAPDPNSTWFLFDSSPPLALELSAEAWLWSLAESLPESASGSESTEQLSRWAAIPVPTGERVPFEVVEQPEHRGDAVYRLDIDPDRSGSEWITIRERTLEIESTQQGRLLYHQASFDSPDRGRLAGMFRSQDDEILLLIRYEWDDDGAGVEHSWRGEYLLSWRPVAWELTELRGTERRQEWRDRSGDFWDSVDVDFDRRPVVAEPGHPCYRFYDAPTDIITVGGETLRIPAIESDLNRPTSHMLGERSDRQTEVEPSGVPGGTFERSVVLSDIEWTWFDEQTHCGEHIRGQYQSVTWSFERYDGQSLIISSFEHGQAERTPIVFWGVGE